MTGSSTGSNFHNTAVSEMDSVEDSESDGSFSVICHTLTSHGEVAATATADVITFF